MKASLNITLAGALIAALGAGEAVACSPPEKKAMAASADVTREDLALMFRAIKTYQAASVTYRECLEDRIDLLGEHEARRLHNESIAAEEELAQAFNRVLAEFKSRSRATR